MLRTPKTGQAKYSSYPDLSIESHETENNLIRNVNIRKNRILDQDQILNLEGSLLQSLKDMMNSEMAVIKEQNKKILESNNEILKLLQIHATNFKEIRDKMEILETENSKSLQRIDDLELQLNMIQKKHYRTMVEIRNVPKKEGEDVHDIVGVLYKVLQIQCTSNLNLNIYRRGKNGAPIIIEYGSSDDKEKLLRAFIKYNRDNKSGPLNAENIGVGQGNTRIYISEPLTSTSKKILIAARELVKSKNYKYCWTSRGNVLVRKEEGQPPIVIRSLSHIKEILSK